MARSSGSLPRYLLTRLLLVIPTLWIILTVVFILMRVAPGDPVQASLGGRQPASVIAAQRHALGFDKPIIVQYSQYLCDVLHGNFGRSTSSNRTVTDVLTHEGAATLELTLAALLIALVLGLSIGVLIGRFRDTPLDVAGRMFGILTYAAPVFWVGILFQLLFVAKLQVLPSSGRADTLVDLDITNFEHTHLHTNLYTVDSILMGSAYNLRNVLVHLIL